MSDTMTVQGVGNNNGMRGLQALMQGFRSPQTQQSQPAQSGGGQSDASHIDPQTQAELEMEQMVQMIQQQIQQLQQQMQDAQSNGQDTSSMEQQIGQLQNELNTLQGGGQQQGGGGGFNPANMFSPSGGGGGDTGGGGGGSVGSGGGGGGSVGSSGGSGGGGGTGAATDPTPITATGNGSQAVQIANSQQGKLAQDVNLPNYSHAGGQTNDCADFVSACVADAGTYKKQSGDPLVTTFQSHLQQQGWTAVPQSQAKPGDVAIILGGGVQHTELVANNGATQCIGTNGTSQEKVSTDNPSSWNSGVTYYTPPKK